MVDRFADGDADNNVKVDRTAPGAFHGRDDDMSHDVVVVAVNRGNSTAAVDVPLPNEWAGLPLHDAWRDTAVVARDGHLTAELHGRQGAIFVVEREQR